MISPSGDVHEPRRPAAPAPAGADRPRPPCCSPARGRRGDLDVPLDVLERGSPARPRSPATARSRGWPAPRPLNASAAGMFVPLRARPAGHRHAGAAGGDAHLRHRARPDADHQRLAPTLLVLADRTRSSLVINLPSRAALVLLLQVRGRSSTRHLFFASSAPTRSTRSASTSRRRSSSAPWAFAAACFGILSCR